MIAEKIINKKNIKVVPMSSRSQYISPSDTEMDERAKQAVKAAVKKAEVCKKPIAKYDINQKKAYIEYANGEIRYVE